jgi:hypothetical protein
MLVKIFRLLCLGTEEVQRSGVFFHSRRRPCGAGEINLTGVSDAP